MSISLCIYLYMVYEYADFLASLPYMFFSLLSWFLLWERTLDYILHVMIETCA